MDHILSRVLRFRQAHLRAVLPFNPGACPFDQHRRGTSIVKVRSTPRICPPSRVSPIQTNRGAHGREAIVNRLLRERDARLAARGPGLRTARGHGGAAGRVDEETAAAVVYGPAETTRTAHRSRDPRGIVADAPDDGCSSSANDQLGEGGGGSPSSMRGDIFFASDLFHTDDTNRDDDDDQNGYAAVDPRAVGAPAAEEALLLRLRDGNTHAAADYDDVYSKQLDATKDRNDRVSWEEEDAALTRSPPPPPPPPPAVEGSRRWLPSERPRVGRTSGGGALDKRAASPPRRDSLKGLVAAGEKGDILYHGVVRTGIRDRSVLLLVCVD